MKPLSIGYNDWYQYGWGENLSDTFIKNSFFHLKLFSNDSELKWLSAMRAGLDAIEKITQLYPAPYQLMCSGGIDSQAMLWLWHISGKPFTVNTIKYVTNDIWFNKDDLAHLYSFCDLHNIDGPVEHVFDVINFLESPEYESLAYKFSCYSPQICTHIKFTELIGNGTLIFSGNFLEYTGQAEGRALAYNPDWTVTGLHRFSTSLSSTKKVIPFFFLFTPELAFSLTRKIKYEIKNFNKKPFIFDDQPIDTNRSEYGSLASYIVKANSYQILGFPVKPQSTKMSGFEKIKEYYESKILDIDPKIKLIASSVNTNPISKFDFYFRYPLLSKAGLDPVPIRKITIPTAILEVLQKTR